MCIRDSYLGNYIYVVYNTETCPIEITCYNDLIDPALKGQITSIDGARNLFPMALVALGYDPNSENEEEIAEAYEWLVKYNENVVAYGNAEQNLTNGTASVAFTYCLLYTSGKRSVWTSPKSTGS